MRRLLQAREDAETHIDITPMLDVVFIMLIFFIVTASFSKETGLDITKPEASQSSEPADIPPIVIEVNAQDEVLVDGRRIDARSIKPTVIRKLAEEPSAAIVVRAHKNSTTRAVILAVDGIRAASGFKAKPPTVTVTQ